MCRIEIRVFSLGVTFSTVLRTPLDLQFRVIWATILPLGCPWRPSEPVLELSWAPISVTGPSLGGLWDSLRGFGWVLSTRCEVAKVCVLEHLGTVRAPLYCFWGVSCACEASSWVPWAAPDALVGVPWRSLGALSVLFCF